MKDIRLRHKFQISLLLAAIIVALGSIPARADVFDFSFSGPTDSGSGTLTADPTGTAGQYLITDISGTVDGYTISDLLPVGTYPLAFPSDPLYSVNDNDLYYPGTNSGYLDSVGFSFQVSGDSADGFNLFYGPYYQSDGTYDGTRYYIILGTLTSHAYEHTVNPITDFELTDTTSEPGSLLLFGTGALGVLFLLRRRQTITQI
jgi:hypothetical protein